MLAAPGDFVADHLEFALPGHSLQGSRLNASESETARLLAGGRARFSPLMPGPFPPHRAIRWPWLARIKARSSSGGRIFSCNMSAWRDDLLRVNGFDERFEGYGGEDQELAKRLRHAGVRRRQLKFAGLAIHLHHTTRAPDDPNDMSSAEQPHPRRDDANARDAQRTRHRYASGRIPPNRRATFAFAERDGRAAIVR